MTIAYLQQTSWFQSAAAIKVQVPRHKCKTQKLLRHNSLNWIKRASHTLPTFEANRVAKTQALSKPHEQRHVATAFNLSISYFYCDSTYIYSNIQKSYSTKIFSKQTINLPRNIINQVSLKFLSLPTLSEVHQSRIRQDTLSTGVLVDNSKFLYRK